ncbi:MAG TPA: sigma-70 family RNA polymerase sigma factor [Planctomycetota bacterium]|nr:sigma-70 family RNA polymerase sigma factor [Planctomycetota bacterium]
MPETAALTPDLLLSHEAFVLRLARSLVRDEASARDVTQETLMAALRHGPPVSGLRGWLARVVRHRASDLRRGERRRAEREANSARPESQPPTPTAAERLELEHGVVRAVLALEEPYRSTVVAIYYEGLSPADVARREGVPAGTVRARLSRALEKLRGTLDREHGGRATWGVALVGLLDAREATMLASGAASGGGATGGALAAWPLAAAGVLAVGATLAVGGWWLVREPETAPPVVAATPAIESVTVEPEQTDLRTPVEATLAVEDDVAAEEEPAKATSIVALDELTALAERTLQLERTIVERRLEVDPLVRARYAWLEALPDAGLTRLVERNSLAAIDELDLPWMQGGGAYFSFTERTHDYQRRPQVALQRGELTVGYYGRFEGAAVDLGEGQFRGMALDPSMEPIGLSEQQRAAWDLMREPVQDYAASDGRWLPTGLRALGLDDDADVEPGHTYAIRAVSPDEFDVLVVVEVAEFDDDGCTLAWRVLEDRPVPDASPVRTPRSTPEEHAPPPVEWRQRSVEDLRAELERVRARGEQLLFDEIPPEVRERFAWFAGRDDSGIVRILERSSRWTDLARVREGGAYWSFAEHSHDYDDDPDLGLESWRFKVGFAGADTGVVVDLGELPLESALQVYGSQRGGDAIEFALAELVDHDRPREEVIASLRELQARVRAMRGQRPEAILGHSYLVRSIVHEAHDLLAVFEVVGLDERGALIAWQIVRTWPVPAGR